MTRTCAGCDGTGSIGCSQRASYHAHVSRHTGHLTYFHAFACDQGICVPCKGEGVVSERIPPEDAIADAETLRVIASQASAGWGKPQNKKIARWVNEAGARTPAGQSPWGWWITLLRVDEQVRSVARAAFRAVPALREESR